MTCTHLKQLYQLCRDSQIQLSSTDLIHIVCKQCENVEVCPSVLYEEYEACLSQRSSSSGMFRASPIRKTITAFLQTSQHIDLPDRAGMFELGCLSWAAGPLEMHRFDVCRFGRRMLQLAHYRWRSCDGTGSRSRAGWVVRLGDVA